MNFRNVVESLWYALRRFISNAIFLSIFFIIFGMENWFNSVLMWCLPLSIGMFLGYLGGRSFVFFIKVKNMLLATAIMSIFSVIVGVLIHKILFQNEEWLSMNCLITLPIILGYILSISDGIKKNILDK